VSRMIIRNLIPVLLANALAFLINLFHDWVIVEHSQRLPPVLHCPSVGARFLDDFKDPEHLLFKVFQTIFDAAVFHFIPRP